MSSFLSGGGSGGFPPAGSNRVWYVAPVLVGTIVGGSGYPSDAQFLNVALTGGSGTGARAGIGAEGGAITQVVATTAGTGYIVGDVLSAASADIGGGSGFTFTITAIGIGNDTNNGLTALTPFGSIQHAVNVAAMIDYQSLYFPRINLAAGTYLEFPGGLILPELLNVGGGGGGEIVGAGYTTTTILGQRLDPSAQAAVQAYGSFAVWFLDSLTVDANGLVGIQGGTDGFIQLGLGSTSFGLTDSGAFGPTLGFKAVQAAGGTVTAVNTDLHILQKLSSFAGTNNTSATNVWGVCSLEFLNNTITLPAGNSGDQPGDSWIHLAGEPSLVSYSGNTVVNAGNYVGAQLVNAALSNVKTDNGTPADFPGVASLNSFGQDTFFGDQQGFTQGAGIDATGDVAVGGWQAAKNTNQATAGKGLGIFFNDAGTIKSLNPDTARVAVQFDKTNDTTLADIPGLTVIVGAGYSYQFNATLFTTSNVATGVKAAVAGTCTATAIIYEGETTSAAAIGAQTRATALGTAVGGVTAVTVARIDIEGLITVNAGGTLTIQFAENAGVAATTSSVLVGSYMSTQQIA